MNTYLNIAAGHQPQQSTLASSGWFIGMLLAIVFLLGVCLVVCLVKRNRGGKYAVQVMSCFLLDMGLLVMWLILFITRSRRQLMADQTMMTKEASQSTHSRKSLVFHIRHRRGLMNVSQPK